MEPNAWQAQAATDVRTVIRTGQSSCLLRAGTSRARGAMARYGSFLVYYL